MEPYQRVHELRKGGQIQEAYSQAKNLLEKYPDNHMLKGSFGWVLYAQAKNLYNQTKTKKMVDCKREVERILREYKELKLSHPSMLFSYLLFYIIRLPGIESALPGFMSWAGLDCFQPEDFKAKKGDQHTFESLVEKVARETAKASRGLDPEQQRFAISLLDKAMRHAEVQKMTWLQYHKGSLLVELGLFKEARSFLVPVVQKKRTEFWAWQILGKVEEEINPEIALALYAKGILVCQDPKFGWRLYEDFCRVALKQNRAALAKWAANQAVTIHKDNAWKLRQSLRDLLKAKWYAEVEVETESRAILEALAPRAEGYLYADCPRYPGSFTETFTSKKNKLMVKIICRVQGRMQEVVSPAQGLPVDKLSPGEPVTVGLLTDADRSVITGIEVRGGGSPYDCLPEYYGVIEHHSPKGWASVYITDCTFCLLKYKEFPRAEGWDPGTPVLMRCLEHNGRLRAYEAKETILKETRNITLVEGTISVKPQGFAFVDNIFIPPHLASKYEDEDQVSFVAVKKPNKKKNEMGWCAIGEWENKD